MPDREKVIEGLKKLHGTSETMTLIAETIILLKEQPEIVRCKDCKYCEYPNSKKEWCKKGHLHKNAETWFCADGEGKCEDA